ncbi:hypothetical protein PTSG_10973 [Salpingoeca rosetta]|uniref:Trafficking protein particle complex subunit 2 n=1 Tax=Salpingoeca rosetta (strain ATCC 50818 / BSB-021) TaxID=946362 RepID=F2USC1_SALR5|nr:uncharacterized protein PTSG_10973 [Salpingoeca rosetta]EGD81030.1 hypothetical protein PTSG_10973 [Salpingoeca rosetta]|eukprot:XP_004987900.1 hypothetical protein PTSG_10973 [Salpingoeca rosetta]
MAMTSSNNGSGGIGGGGCYFVIVSANDKPLYEQSFGNAAPAQDDKRDESKHLHQFIAHSALDAVDQQLWKSKDMYLKVVDRFNEWMVSAYVTPSKTRFLLVHDMKADDVIKGFFQDVHELYTKALANPLLRADARITSPRFHSRMDVLLRRFHT